jgi:FkbM family methyltransferase
MNNFLKKIATKLIHWYIAPLEWNYKLGLYAKGRLLHFKEEHILSFVDYVKKNDKIDPNDWILDAGVYYGGVSAMFATHFPAHKVIGFEPIPKHYKAAVQHCAAYKNVQLLNKALSDKTGTQTFHIATNSSASSLNPIAASDRYELAEKIEVETVTLLDFLPPTQKVLCFKLDIEGYELAVLQAAGEALGRVRYVIAEMNNHNEHSNECQYYEVDAFLRAQNFKLLIIRAGYNDTGLMQYDAVYKNMSI